jgi:cyanophycinase
VVFNMKTLTLILTAALLGPTLVGCADDGGPEDRPGHDGGKGDSPDDALTANGTWQTNRIRALGRVRQRITLQPGSYQLAWTDHFGYLPRSRRPSCTLNMRLVAPNGNTVVDAHNSSRDANQLGFDPITFVVESAGEYILTFDEIDNHSDDFEVQLRGATSTTRPPEGLTVYTAGATDQNVSPATRATIALAGGGTDNDNAMKALLSGGGNGDVVVLRMDDTGGGYAEYFQSLGAASVSELVFDAKNGNDVVAGQDLASLRTLANSAWVEDKINRAEIVFFAGGNQTKYVDVFHDTKLAAAVTALATQRKGAIGGTSAGMHVLASIVHTPRGAGNSVTSDGALQDPFIGQGERSGTASLEFSNAPMSIPRLRNMITDTHWSQRNRQGRSIVFLARALQDLLSTPQALHLVACDEGTAVVIDDAGVGRVFGTPGNAAWFFAPASSPDLCQDNMPLQWTAGVTRIAVGATIDGQNAFKFDTWQPTGQSTRKLITVRNGRVSEQ